MNDMRFISLPGRHVGNLSCLQHFAVEAHCDSNFWFQSSCLQTHWWREKTFHWHLHFHVPQNLEWVCLDWGKYLSVFLALQFRKDGWTLGEQHTASLECILLHKVEIVFRLSKKLTCGKKWVLAQNYSNTIRMVCCTRKYQFSTATC